MNQSDGNISTQVTLVIALRSPLEYLKTCLLAVKDSAKIPLDLIFAANRQVEAETRAFVNSISNALLIEAPDANNHGALLNRASRNIKTEFIVFLDDDTLPQGDWLESMIQIMKSEPKIGAVGAVTVHPHNKKILQAGITIGADYHPLYEHRENFHFHVKPDDMLDHPLAVSGSCMLVRRRALENVSYFSETYHNEFEDVDLGLRMGAVGYEVRTCASAVVLHSELSKVDLTNRRHNLNTLMLKIESNPDIKSLIRNRIQGLDADYKSFPLVSLLYPAFNDQAYLKDSIESILNQTYRNWELCIVNDASTDRTPEILESYQQAYPDRIRIFFQQEHDRCNAWETLYKVSRGDYLAILGADDVLLPDKLSEQVRCLEADPNCAYVYTDVYRFDDKGTFVNHWHFDEPAPERQILELLKNSYICTPSVLLRRAFVEQSGGWLDRKFLYSQDYDLWLRMLRGHTIARGERPLLKYRVHDAQLTAIAGEKKMSECCAAVIRDKFERWKAAEVFSFLDLTSNSDLTALYATELEGFVQSYFIRWGGLQSEAILFCRDLLNQSTENADATKAKRDFLIKISYYMYKKQASYRIAIYCLYKALLLDPFVIAELGGMILRKSVRRLRYFIEPKVDKHIN